MHPLLFFEVMMIFLSTIVLLTAVVMYIYCYILLNKKSNSNRDALTHESRLE
jgi:predicted membrane protein